MKTLSVTGVNAKLMRGMLLFVNIGNSNKNLVVQILFNFKCEFYNGLEK